MNDAALAWQVEEVCLNAWPALRQVLFDGWVLRFSGGLTRRANSANPLGIEHADPAALIANCETLYRDQRQPAIFRLPSLIGLGIDECLAACGYNDEGHSLVLYTGCGAIPAERDPAVRLLSRPTAEWFATMAALQRHTKKQAQLYRRIVRALAIPAAFAVLVDDGAVGALAFGAIHRDLICYESVVTDPQQLRRGYARRIIASLAAWAVERGATGACLEVEAANTPALALYDRLGFSELYRYHYRRQPIPPP
ncbi:MAG: GNAT family N-acetyltransferase [Alphaproteobacteria bacterium]|nr:GNAT family N-acetyltransferase [Alphaproteobacteria bacterium]